MSFEETQTSASLVKVRLRTFMGIVIDYILIAYVMHSMNGNYLLENAQHYIVDYFMKNINVSEKSITFRTQAENIKRYIKV